MSRPERLSPLDMSNLRVEAHGQPMNVAALAILERAPLLDPSGSLALAEIRAHLEHRLSRAPRLRQKLWVPPLGFGPSLWIDDAGFDVRQHVHTRAVPLPADEEALLRWCAERNEQPLDRDRPLWEMWFLTGLSNGTVAMLIRFHHVLADGMAALALLGSLFDEVPDVLDREPHAWIPRWVPSRRALLVDNLLTRTAAVRGFVTHVAHPRTALHRLGALACQVGQVMREGRAPRVSFNRPVGKHHHLALVRADLDCVKAVAHAHHATVNDVVLTAIAGGARALLAHRGELTGDLRLKVSVAASVRAPHDDTAGNLVGIMIVAIPVGEPDPVRRLQQIALSTAERKRLPPNQPAGRLMQRWMVHVMDRQRLVNLLASNLPGPPHTMYFARSKILEVFQMGVVQGNLSLSVGALSYAGQLNLDIVGDVDAVPDLAAFATGTMEDLQRLDVGCRAPAIAG